MKKSVFCALVTAALFSDAARALSIDITTMQYYDATGTPGPAQNSQFITTVLFNAALNGFMSEPFFGPNSMTAYQVMWDDTVTGSSVNWSGTSASGSYTYDYTLDADEVAVGLMYNSGAVTDVAILQIFDCSDTINCTGVNNDPTHPGVPGTEMINGPWAGQHLTFSGLTAVPAPVAVWLFGSGLVVLLGASARKTS